jgi:hypothetical protein
MPPPDYDEYDDRRGADDAPGDREAILDRARGKALVPGIFLILVGGLTLAVFGYSLATMGDMDPQLDKAVADNDKQIDADPKLTDDQKKQAKELTRNIVDAARRALPVAIPVVTATGLVVLLAGVCLIRLSARWLVILGSVLAIIPLTTFCCTGIPFGVWALVAVNSKAVAAGYRVRGMG